MKRTFLAGLLTSLLCACPAIAQTSRPTSQPTSRRSKKLRKKNRARKRNKGNKVVDAGKSEVNSTRLLSEIDWYSDLEQVKSIARKKKKLIFWMHAVGDLPGKI